MGLFEHQIKEEFLKLERWIKYVAIPFFTLLTVVFLAPFPFKIDKSHLIFHIVFSFLGVVGCWFFIRLIIGFFRKRLFKIRFWVRLTLQLIVSSLAAILVSWLLNMAGTWFLIDNTELCHDFDDFNSKNLYITAVLFALLINIIYESFYLFIKLSEKAVETERYKKESIEAQYQNLTSRLNPHFLFNSLNTLTTVVEEDPKKAVDYIRELSAVYRYVLNSQKYTWADLAAELKFSQSYISLLKMRFEGNLRISISICNDYLNYHILAMTMQLLIENAVKHNEISDSYPLEIKIYCKDEMLVVTNGKQKRRIMPTTTKVGLHNISERYKFLVNKNVIVEDSEETYTVKVPLVKNMDENRVHIEEYL